MTGDPNARVHAYYRHLGTALRALLIEKGIFSEDELRREIVAREKITPMLGARAVARAWCDPAFKDRLLADGDAIRELGIEPGARLSVVANTPRLHNLIVCTLCSCYPRNVLGLPPRWYKSREYRARAVREPRAVLAEFGTRIPVDVEVRVHDATADLRYLVLPLRPAGTEDWDEDALAALITRDCMIGVALPKTESRR